MNHQNLVEIAHNHKSPVYVYDTHVIERQYSKLINAFKNVPKLKINYAVKALSNISILKFMKHLGAGLDTVSIEEIHLGLIAGFKAEDIIFTPNGVSLNEIEEAASLGCQINIDNLSVLELFGHRQKHTPVCIRINPHIMAGGNANISVGHIDSKFGISIHQMPHILRIVKNTGMTINGIHMHTGSDILDTDVFIKASEILFDAATHFNDLEFIDFGSGFKVPYHSNDIATNVEELGKKLSKRFNRFCKTYGKELTLAFEPGKFLVSESGQFLTKVNAIKQTTSTVFAQVNSGFNHLSRPMFYGAHHDIENISNPNGAKRFYSVVGYICETDTFANNRPISTINEGDVLSFKNAGAYCYSMASNYNSRLRPAEVLWYNNEAHVIRNAETLDDLLKNQTNIDVITTELENSL